MKRYMYASKADNPPHIFAVADQAYQMMIHNKKHQVFFMNIMKSSLFTFNNLNTLDSFMYYLYTNNVM